MRIVLRRKAITWAEVGGRLKTAEPVNSLDFRGFPV